MNTKEIWISSDHNETFHTEELQQHLLLQRCGCVLLDGYSGCGKTQLLRSLKHLSHRPVHLFSYQDIVEVIVKTRVHCTPFLLELDVENCIICIEDIDFLRGKDATQEYLSQMINLAARQHLILITGNGVLEKLPKLCKLCNPTTFIATR